MSSLNRIAHAREQLTREARGRIVPSSFDPNDPDLSALTLPEDYRWDTCREFLEHTGARGVMSRLPLFWQTEMLLHDACRSARTYLFVCDRENLPVGALALKERIVDTIVTDFDDAERFLRFLIDGGHSVPKHWLIVRGMEQPHARLMRPQHASITEEIHLVPGVPLLRSCATLGARKETAFHRCKLPDLGLGDYRAPISYHSAGPCECGEEMVHISSV